MISPSSMSTFQKMGETKRAIRKDAVRCCSFMISANPEFFEGLSPECEKAFFQSNLAFLQERYGKEIEKTMRSSLGFIMVRC
ncbi:MAG: plasmid recombination protein [Bacillota bacterium]